MLVRNKALLEVQTYIEGTFEIAGLFTREYGDVPSEIGDIFGQPGRPNLGTVTDLESRDNISPTLRRLKVLDF